VIAYEVPREEDGARLDRLVAAAAGVSRRVARIWIASGRVKVGGQVVRVLAREIRAGRRVEIEPESESATPAGHVELPLVHLDRWVAAVNKPAGLLSERDRHGAPSVESVLPEVLAERRERTDLWLVHRLDAPTSGVLLLARTPQAAERLGEAFRSATAKKLYLALVQGRLERRLDINEPIARVRGTLHAVQKGGKPAHTLVEPLASSESATLVAARPRTGRTHQIRVHLAHAGHPLWGDGAYGGPRYTNDTPPRAIGRAMLHAARLEVPHPKSGETLRLEAAVPADFRALAEALGVWRDPLPV
jgi:23S rRNA pseudouridine1911/1915/1917 synthase